MGGERRERKRYLPFDILPRFSSVPFQLSLTCVPFTALHRSTSLCLPRFTSDAMIMNGRREQRGNDWGYLALPLLLQSSQCVCFYKDPSLWHRCWEAVWFTGKGSGLGSDSGSTITNCMTTCRPSSARETQLPLGRVQKGWTDLQGYC